MQPYECGNLMGKKICPTNADPLAFKWGVGQYRTAGNNSLQKNNILRLPNGSSVCQLWELSMPGCLA